MRPEVREGDAAREVVEAARRWRREGLIDAAGEATIDRLYGDDRRRTRGGFRVLFFVLTLNAGIALWAFAEMVFDTRLFSDSHWVRSFALSAVATAAAAWGCEVAVTRFRLRRFGVEEGLAALTIFFLAFAAMPLFDHTALGNKAQLAAICATLGLAAAVMVVRWALPLAGALASALLLLGTTALHGARWIWLAGGLAAAAGAWRLTRTEACAVAHRARAAEAFVVAAVAVYWSVHVTGLERGLFPWLGRSERLDGDLWRALAWMAMAAWPLALLWLGGTRRDRLALSLGAVGILATGASAVDALDLDPAWGVLIAAGGALLALAVGLRRWFARCADRIRGGFTDAALGEAGGAGFVEIVAMLAALSPEPQKPSETVPEGFRGGGGEFGGGGATGRF